MNSLPLSELCRCRHNSDNALSCRDGCVFLFREGSGYGTTRSCNPRSLHSRFDYCGGRRPSRVMAKRRLPQVLVSREFVRGESVQAAAGTLVECTVVADCAQTWPSPIESVPSSDITTTQY